MSSAILVVILLCLITEGESLMMNSINNDSATDLYRAPWGHSRGNPSELAARGRPLPSFVITSRPLMFSQENSADGSAESDERKTNGGATTTKRWPWQKPKQRPSAGNKQTTKVSLTFLPGKATVVCKGVSCSQQGSFSSSASSSSSASNFGFYGSDVINDDDDDDDTGFAGEAIPIDATEDFTTVIMNENKPVLLPVTQKPKKPASATGQVHTSAVHLLTKRPYLNRVRPSTSKRSTTSSVSYIRRRSTTSSQRRRSTSVRPTTIVRRRQASTTSTTTRPPPQQSAPLTRPGGGGNRPSFFFPAAMTAFTLMALPMAAAAVPFLFQVGRKRRSAVPETVLERILALHRPGHDFETIVHELDKILEKDAGSSDTSAFSSPRPEVGVVAATSAAVLNPDSGVASDTFLSANDGESRRRATVTTAAE